MRIERFISPNELIYRLTVGDQSVRYHVGSIEQLWLIVYTHNTEAAILEEVSVSLTDDDLLLDVGANLGVYSSVAGTVGADVAAVEPLQGNGSVALKNIRLNCETAQLLPFALSDTNGVVGMKTKESSDVDDQAAIGGSNITASALRGDALVKRHLNRTPTAVKIDVEGSELEVLDGLSQTLSSDECRRVFLEVHTDQLPSEIGLSEFQAQLESFGFSTSIIEQRDQTGDEMADQVFIAGEK